MTRRFLKWVILYAALFFIAVQCFPGLLFLMSHLPPSVVHLDRVIRILGTADRVFTLPRRTLRSLWPGEMTPTLLNYTLAVVNWLVWGAILATWRTFRTRPT